MRYNTILSFILIIILGIGCSGPGTSPKDSKLMGLASPILLNQDTVRIILSDYFPTGIKIDSIKCDHDIQTSTVDDFLFLVEGKGVPPVSNITIFAEGLPYSIPIRRPNILAHIFNLKFDQEYEDVRIKGEFNSWNADELVLSKTDTSWQAVLFAPARKYQYKIVADGNEISDPNNPVEISNNMGGYNNVLNMSIAPSSTPQLITHSFDKKQIKLLAKNIDNIYAYWENFKLEVHQSADTFSIEIPAFAKYEARSHIRVYGSGTALSSNDLLIPLKKGKVIADASNLNNNDWHSSIIYFTFLDRFYDGDETNNVTDHPEGVLKKAQYQGGDIKGVTAKIREGYFADLGINTIWISPITTNPEGAWGQFKDPDTKYSGYHGYWPISSTQVDYRLGNSNDVEELLAVAHKNGISVLLDYVANHVHEEHPIYQKNQNWATPLYLPDGRMNTELWDEHRLTTWFDTFLPTLNLESPRVASVMVDSAAFWLETYDFDGIRHDATKHIPLNFWRELTLKVKEISAKKGKKFYQLGETYGDYDLVQSFVGSGLLDGQFDFNMYDAGIEAFAKDGSLVNLSQKLKESLESYGHHHLMANISGNHDKPRFVSIADGSVNTNLPRNEQKRVGWKQDLVVSDSAAYKKLALFHAYNFMLPGIPVVYYGDELGMAGGDDPGCRDMMRFENITKEEAKLKAKLQELIQLRNENLALSYGSTEILHVEENILIIRRKYFDNEVTMMINKGPNESNVKQQIKGELIFNLTADGYSFTVTKS